MKKKLIITLLLATFLGTLPAIASETEEETLFPDVDEDSKYREAIIYLYEEGVIEGYEDGTFGPDNEVNRAEALKMLLESANIEVPEETDVESVFSDLDGDEWFYKYIEEAVDRKIVSGYEDGTFQGTNSINLVEMLKMLVNTYQLVAYAPDAEAEFFADANADAWYASYLNYANDTGLIYADADNNIDPGHFVTRKELAYLIYRHKHADQFSGEVGFGIATYYADYFDGLTTANGEQYDQFKYTAAHLTLPFNTIVRVTNLANDETVEVRINDRGPYAEGHVIDLSKVAFQKIGYLSSGIMNVEYEIIYPES